MVKQRINFLGSLRFMRNRSIKNSIKLILVICLRKCKRDQINPAELLINRFFVENNVNISEFWRDISVDWRFDLNAGDRVLYVLKKAFYDGNIDDLWLSVVGVKKLPRPLIKEKIKYIPKKATVLFTGQTRKIGSRRSTQ